MAHHPQQRGPSPGADPLADLQQEIQELDAQLQGVKGELREFNARIHARLDRQMSRMEELADLYKQQKREKKAKRLEQKKRGKNWVEPTQLRKTAPPLAAAAPQAPDALRQELRRLYKEVVVQVHPDKFIHAGEQDRIRQATAITAQLNGIYQRGDLEELIHFYHTILHAHTAGETGAGALADGVDTGIRLESLRRKADALARELAGLKESYLYTVLKTYENPLVFIEELQQHVAERIKQLEKRTRIHKGGR